jgi:hypothetical protein
MKEVSLLEMIGRSFAKVAAGAWCCSTFDLAHVRDARHRKYAIWLHVASVHLLSSHGLEFSHAQPSHHGGIVLSRADRLDWLPVTP